MDQSSGPILRLTDISIRRGDNWLVREANWTVNPGENWVVLGPNGSGKTSLLSTITGYLQVTSGSIHVLGHSYGTFDWREMRKRIGFVGSSLQKLMVPEELAIEIVAGGRDAAMDIHMEDLSEDYLVAARNLLKRLGISRLAERPWRVLSQGERQRVLIGRALMARPGFMILDEPCAGLDPVSREKFLTFLAQLSERRSAPPMVFVTHHVEEIRPFFTHALLMSRGRVISAGPIREALNNQAIRKSFGKSASLHRKGDKFSMHVQLSGSSVA